MKKLFIVLIATTIIKTSSKAQEVPNQNINYKISQDHYTRLADSLLKFQGTTIQNTYKAIDYMQAKQDRKEARKNFRQQLRLERARNPYYWNNWGGNSNWNSPYYNNWNSFTPDMGYRTGNWTFWY